MQELGAPALFMGENPCITLQSALHRHTSTSGNSTNRRSCSRVGCIFLKESVYLWTCTVQTHAVQGPYNSIVLTPKHTTARILSQVLDLACLSTAHLHLKAHGLTPQPRVLSSSIPFFCQKRHPSSRPSENPQNHDLSFLLFLFYILLITRSSRCCLPDYVSHTSLFSTPIATGLSQSFILSYWH